MLAYFFDLITFFGIQESDHYTSITTVATATTATTTKQQQS
jgi:hypothetical protein